MGINNASNIKYTGTLKDWGYIVGYQIDEETIILLFIKTPKNIFSYSVSQCDNNSAYTMTSNISGGTGEVALLQESLK